MSDDKDIIVTGIILFAIVGVVFGPLIYALNNTKEETTTATNHTNTIVYNNTVVYNTTTTILNKVWVTREKSVQCQGFGMNESTLYTIDGGSMQPTLWEGDRLWVKKYEPKKSVARGEIVVRQNNDGTRTIHRVTRTEETCYVTQGDNNEYEDTCEPYNTILAVVCGHTW